MYTPNTKQIKRKQQLSALFVHSCASLSPYTVHSVVDMMPVSQSIYFRHQCPTQKTEKTEEIAHATFSRL